MNNLLSKDCLQETIIGSPLLSCCPLARFNLEIEDWNEIEAAFAKAATCEMRQSWRKNLEAHFEPAVVRTAWTPEVLWVYAEICDRDIFNAATRLNQDTFLLGDVFEIFLRPLPGPEYFELHVTPDNHHLQLRFKQRPGPPLSDALIGDENFFRSRARVEIEANRWRVLAEIPARNLIARPIKAGDEWRFSFCRYDYTRGQSSPVLSSTSRYRRVDFHDEADWGTLIFSE